MRPKVDDAKKQSDRLLVCAQRQRQTCVMVAGLACPIHLAGRIVEASGGAHVQEFSADRFRPIPLRLFDRKAPQLVASHGTDPGVGQAIADARTGFVHIPDMILDRAIRRSLGSMLQRNRIAFPFARRRQSSKTC
jgi:hypothetical protein